MVRIFFVSALKTPQTIKVTKVSSKNFHRVLTSDDRRAGNDHCSAGRTRMQERALLVGATLRIQMQLEAVL
jgi:hypothetical protein